MRTTMSTVLAAAVVATGLAAVPAAGEERVCRGALAAATVDNLRVPDGASCRLWGTRVKGTITVGTGARLVATGVRVVGNVQAEGHRSVILRGGTVGGSVQLVQGREATVRLVRIGGDLQSFENSGTQRFVRNRIDGNLQCKENRRRPLGGGNIVDGQKEDQCRRH